MDLNFRPLVQEDGYEWYTLLDEVWRDAYSDIFPQEVFDGRDWARKDRASRFAVENFQGERKIAYVAESQGKIVGVMFGTLDSDYEAFKGDYADLVILYIYPEYQGKGIGTALRDIFIEWAKGKGSNKYVVGVLKDNSKARQVYASWGGVLSDQSHDFTVMGVGYPEVFYTFDI